MTQTIRKATTRRQAHRPAHRARPAAATEPQGEMISERYKDVYIGFINGLMYRMKMDSISRMLDTALNEGQKVTFLEKLEEALRNQASSPCSAHSNG